MTTNLTTQIKSAFDKAEGQNEFLAFRAALEEAGLVGNKDRKALYADEITAEAKARGKIAARVSEYVRVSFPPAGWDFAGMFDAARKEKARASFKASTQDVVLQAVTALNDGGKFTKAACVAAVADVAQKKRDNDAAKAGAPETSQTYAAKVVEKLTRIMGKHEGCAELNAAIAAMQALEKVTLTPKSSAPKTPKPQPDAVNKVVEQLTSDDALAMMQQQLASMNAMMAALTTGKPRK